MLGSVLGLNLRNIAWHGFLSPHETSQAFVATIIFILADCGRILKNTNKIKNIPCRPHVTFEEVNFIQYSSKTFNEVSFLYPPLIAFLVAIFFWTVR